MILSTLASLLFLLPVAAQQPQLTLYADLSGEWRISSDDNARYAQPAFDDKTWKTVTLPWNRERPIGVYWLRKTIALPRGGREGLSVTIGNVNETYELYVDGLHIATTPGFGSADPPYFHPRVFALPAEAAVSDTTTIAIRIWRPRPVLWIRKAYSADLGPYQLAPLEVARELAQHINLQSRYLPYLLLSPLHFFIGAYLLWTFRTSREWTELFWLGCFCIVGSTLAFYLSALERSVFAWWTQYSIAYNTTSALAIISLAEFEIAVLRVDARIWRWVIWLALPAAMAQHIFPYPNLSPVVIPSVFCVFWGVRGLLGSKDLRIAAALVTTYAAQRISLVVAGVTGVSLLPQEINLGPVRAPTLSLTSIIIGVVLLSDTLKRLLREKSEKQRLAGELEAARQVQQLLMPGAEVIAADCTVEAVYRPSQEVGGDFYQFLHGEDGALVVVMGDVSGKGLKAAMLVAVITGALGREECREPVAILNGLNRALDGNMQSGFATCCCVRLEPGGRVLIANAGHPAPYANGREVEIAGGLPLGVTRDMEYEATALLLEPGQQLTVLSDGVVEATNNKGELFGFDRTRMISGKPAVEVADAACAWGQNDDITVVTVRRSA